MKLLKEMIENIINEDNDNAKVKFHSYVNIKMQKLTESSTTSKEDLIKEIKSLSDNIPKVYFDANIGNGRTESGYGKSIVKIDDDWFINIDATHNGSKLRTNLSEKTESQLENIIKKLRSTN